MNVDGNQPLKSHSRQVTSHLFQAKKFAPAKLSKHKYEEPEAELKLSDELSGNLRSMKPEGNLLADRLVVFHTIEHEHKIFMRQLTQTLSLCSFILRLAMLAHC